MNSIDKERIFDESIIALYQKYGIIQVISAISYLINNGKYDYFTNGDKYYRVQMKQNVSKEDAMHFIRKKTKKYSKKIDDQHILLFCYRVFGQDLINKLAQVCIVTIDKNDDNQAKYALKIAISRNSFEGFTKFSDQPDDKTNYRELVSKLSGKNIYDIICFSLGIGMVKKEVSEVDYLINLYIEKLIEYKEEIEKNKKSL